jgi:succinate-semialdehyde dehydrogenase/glutarate-semialdehyde dehydrogenase
MRRANALRFGLAAYAFTRDPQRLERLRRNLQAGMLGLNNFAVSRPELPFTGVKASGYGYACGEEGLEGFVVRRTVARRCSFVDVGTEY